MGGDFVCADRQTNKQTYRQTNKQTDKQTNKLNFGGVVKISHSAPANAGPRGKYVVKSTQTKKMIKCVKVVSI